jgi:hypothetical protein
MRLCPFAFVMNSCFGSEACVSVTYCTIIALVIGERGDPFTCEERCGAPRIRTAW